MLVFVGGLFPTVGAVVSGSVAVVVALAVPVAAVTARLVDNLRGRHPAAGPSSSQRLTTPEEP